MDETILRIVFDEAMAAGASPPAASSSTAAGAAEDRLTRRLEGLERALASFEDKARQTGGALELPEQYRRELLARDVEQTRQRLEALRSGTPATITPPPAPGPASVALGARDLTPKPEEIEDPGRTFRAEAARGVLAPPGGGIPRGVAPPEEGESLADYLRKNDENRAERGRQALEERRRQMSEEQAALVPPPAPAPAAAVAPQPPEEPHRESNLAVPPRPPEPGPAPVPVEVRLSPDVAAANLEAFFGKFPGMDVLDREQRRATGGDRPDLQQQRLLEDTLGPRPGPQEPSALEAVFRERQRLLLRERLGARIDELDALHARQMEEGLRILRAQDEQREGILRSLRAQREQEEARERLEMQARDEDYHAETLRLRAEEVRRRQEIRDALADRAAAETRAAQEAFREGEANRRAEAQLLGILGGQVGGVLGAGLDLLAAVRSIPGRAPAPVKPEEMPEGPLPAGTREVPAATAPPVRRSPEEIPEVLPAGEPAAPTAPAGPKRPPAPEYFRDEYLELKPDAALQKAQQEALAAGKTPEQASAAGRRVADYTLEHSQRPETVYKRELIRHTDAGVSDDDAMKMAREAADRAAAERRVRAESPRGEQPATAPEPTPMPAPGPGAKVAQYRAWAEPPPVQAAGAEGAGAGVAGAEAAGVEGAAAGAAGAGAAAAAGPVGLIVIAAQQLKEEVEKKLVGGVREAGEALAHLGQLDGRGLAEQANRGLETLCTTGKIAAEVNRALFGFADALNATAGRLAPYSGQLATSQALAGVAQVQGDIRRADILGPELSQFVDAQSKLSQSSQDVLAKLLKPLIPIMTGIVDWLAQLMDQLDRNMDAILAGIEGAVNQQIDVLNAILETLSLGIAPAVGHIKLNMPTKPPGPVTGPFAQQLRDSIRLALSLSPVNMVPPVAPPAARLPFADAFPAR